MTKVETPINAAGTSSKIKKRKKEDQGEDKAPPKHVKSEDLSREDNAKEEIDVSKTVVVVRDKGKGVAREEKENEEENEEEKDEGKDEEMTRFVRELKEIQKGIPVKVPELTIVDVLG